MSITARDLLRLPSLKQSRLLAGEGGLDRVVSTVSVLETVSLDMLPGTVFQYDNICGNEITITGFLNCRDDVELQCALVQRMIDMRTVGIILFYVGLAVPAVSDQLIELCNSRNFVLICMPEGQLSYRYSDVIFEIMEAIISERAQHMHFTTSLLEEISQLPQRQYSVDTVLRLISTRLHISLLLVDSRRRVLNSASWPPQSDNLLKELLQADLPPADNAPCLLNEDGSACRIAVFPDKEKRMELFLMKAVGQLRPETVMELADLVRLSVNLWNSTHDAVTETELIRAIIQDEPLKMRGISKLLGVDVAELHTMGILHLPAAVEQSVADQLQQGIQDVLRPYFDAILVGAYGGCMLFFTNRISSLGDEQQLTGYILALMDRMGCQGTLTWCGQLDNAAQAADSFQLQQTCLQDAQKIYPTRRIFRRQELEFARRCRDIVNQGTDSLQAHQELLRQITSRTEGDDFIQTLAVFLLDTGSSRVETSRRMYLHKNTVKL